MGNADNPNVWTIARRRDKALWTEGQRHHARLSWLNAPQSAFDGASTYKTDMQNSTCNSAGDYGTCIVCGHETIIKSRN